MAAQKSVAEAAVGCDHPLLVLGTFPHPVPRSAELELRAARTAVGGFSQCGCS